MDARSTTEAAAGGPRVLLIADHCSPAQTSVPLVSWYYYMALRKRVGVHLVTHARNREPITRRLDGRVEGITFIDSDAVHRPLLKMVRMLGARNGKGWTMISAAHTLAFYWFERLALREFGPRVARGEFDIVHRLTPLSTATPSSVIHRWRAPVVLGPLNGGLPWPPGFENVRTKEREWLSPFRRLTRHLPGWRRTFRVASCVISGSVDAWKQLEGVAAGKHVYLPRNGVDTGAFADSERPGRDASRPLEVVFVGRLVPYKGADVMLEACAGLMRAGRARVTIAGKGPQMEELKGVVERLGVGGAVVFRGDVPHAELPGLYAASDVFVMPSIREFGGAVVLERIRRWQRHGGRVIVTTPNLYRLRNLVRFAMGKQVLTEFRQPARGEGIGHFIEYTEKHLRWQIEKAGLEVERLDLVQLTNVGFTAKARVQRWLSKPLLARRIWRDSLLAVARKPAGAEIGKA